jgi:hypothetical protein
MAGTCNIPRVDILDDDSNWLRWGELVKGWIFDSIPRPRNVKELRAVLANAHIVANVDGADDREVKIYTYEHDDPDKPIEIPIPNDKMLRKKLLKQGITLDDDGNPLPNGPDNDTHIHEHNPFPYNPHPYPLPLFYDLAYPSPPTTRMGFWEAYRFAMRRIGEYTVNECC